MNLFMVFDPKVSIFSLSFSMNWLSSLTFMVFTISSFWLLKSLFIKAWDLILNLLSKEINLNFGGLPSPGVSHLVVSLFMMLLLNNYLGLISYVFTSSSHLVFSVSIALLVWVALMMWFILKNFNLLLAHLVPGGTPYVLIPIMVIIEFVSNIIRPLTLSVRLAANMVAGHLLLSLISGSVYPLNFVSWMLVVGIFLMMILENAVSIIQAYVFSMLSSLYLSEVNFPYY